MAEVPTTHVGGFHGPQVCGLVGISYRQLDYWGKRIEKDIDKLSPTERVKSYLKMMELILTYKALAPNTTKAILAEMESIFETQREKMREPAAPPANGTDQSI